MSLEVDLYTLLSTDPGVLAAMDGQNNVYLGMVSKGISTNLALVLQVVITNSVTAADGFVNFFTKRVQFDSYATRYPDSVALSDAVRKLLRSYKGTLSSVDIQGVMLREEIDLPNEPGNTGYVFRRMMTLDFFYHEL